MYVYTNKAAGPGKGMSCFILDTKSRGVTITGMKKVGSLPSSEGDLFFDNVEIPSENLLGEEGKAYGPVLWLVGINRATHAARGLGVAEAAFDFALDYAKQRVVFGQPIAKHEYLSFKFAKMATQIEAVRSMVYRAAWLYDQNDESWPKLAAMAKLMSGETAQWVTGEAMQIQGGYGLMMDSPLQRYWRDSKFLAITEGTLEVLQIVISRALGIK
jgi:alkylation response protein AidB-like acyl-CoA dehydrogenase